MTQSLNCFSAAAALRHNQFRWKANKLKLCLRTIASGLVNRNPLLLCFLCISRINLDVGASSSFSFCRWWVEIFAFITWDTRIANCDDTNDCHCKINQPFWQTLSLTIRDHLNPKQESNTQKATQILKFIHKSQAATRSFNDNKNSLYNWTINLTTVYTWLLLQKPGYPIRLARLFESHQASFVSKSTSETVLLGAVPIAKFHR